MQPQKKKVVVLMAVSLGIIGLASLIPTVIIPSFFSVSNASNCASSLGCSQDTFSRCGAYESSGNSTSLIDSMGRGMKGMMCMLGLDRSTELVLFYSSDSIPVTLNKA
ncbi:MAG TPA: hypothetical protein VIB07_08450 [Nitrososphaera sp.]|jgi:hypothetical protein